MYIYEISEGNYEYLREIMLSHEFCYTEEEFKAIVIGAINYNRKHHKAGEEEHVYNDICRIVETLVKIYGFVEYTVPIQASVYDGWSIARLAR